MTYNYSFSDWKPHAMPKGWKTTWLRSQFDNSDDGIYGDQGNENFLPSWPRVWYTKPIIAVLQWLRNPRHDYLTYYKGFAHLCVRVECDYINPDDRKPATYGPPGRVQRAASYSSDGRVGYFWSWKSRWTVFGRHLCIYRGCRPGGAYTSLPAITFHTL